MRGEGGRPLFLGINDCERLPQQQVEIHAPAKIDPSTCTETVERPSNERDDHAVTSQDGSHATLRQQCAAARQVDGGK